MIKNSGHKGQVSLLVVVLGVLAVAFVASYFFLGNSSTSGKVVLTNTQTSTCQTIDVAANYLTVGPYSCIGLGSSSASCTIQLQNKESDSIAAQPVFTCKTASDEQKVTAAKRSLAVDEVGDFTVSFDNQRSDWTCTMTNAGTTKPKQICN